MQQNLSFISVERFWIISAGLHSEISQIRWYVMITSFLKDNKKINYMNTLFKDLELKNKNSKYYKGKIAPNLISRQNWSELCIWNNERSLVQVLTRPHCWVNSRNQYKIDFFSPKNTHLLSFCFSLFILLHFNQLAVHLLYFRGASWKPLFSELIHTNKLVWYYHYYYYYYYYYII